jgi:hypothetical protein
MHADEMAHVFPEKARPRHGADAHLFASFRSNPRRPAPNSVIPAARNTRPGACVLQRCRQEAIKKKSRSALMCSEARIYECRA